MFIPHFTNLLEVTSRNNTNLVHSMAPYDFSQVNNENNKVYQWLCADKLSLNLKKTKLLFNPTVHYGNIV